MEAAGGQVGKRILAIAVIAAVVVVAALSATSPANLRFISGPPGPEATGPNKVAAGDGPAEPACAVDPETMTAPGCETLRDDTGVPAAPRHGLWGSIDCADRSRVAWSSADGDPAPTATGASQANDAYRRLTVLDGDNVYGERCELGRNSHTDGENRGSQTSGTFALYRDGERRITFFSERYPENFSVAAPAWQTIAQMKQTQPADNAGLGPVLELQLWDNRLWLQNSWRQAWVTRAPRSRTWIRFAVDVVYSADPAVGSVTVYVDLNGDGDALDAGERSPRLPMATLIAETDGTAGATDGVAAGEAIPDHLRLGLYHEPSLPCPPPNGCSVDIDNVEVLGP
jgi:hypothetical protein